MTNFIIEEISAAAYAELAQAFQQNLDYFISDPDSAFFKERSEASYEIAESWSPRIEGARFVISAVTGETFFGTAGLMILRREPDHVYVDYLTTHPLSSRAGFLLLEHALQISSTNTIKLYDASGGPFYTNLGFIPENGDPGSKKLFFRGAAFNAR